VGGRKNPQEKKMTQISLLNQTAGDKSTTEQALDNKGRILQYAFWLKKEGYSTSTILSRSKLVQILAKRGANLHNEESVKETIAEQPWSLGRKANAVDAYTTFLRMTGASWEPPRYQGIRKIPFIPTEAEVDQLIAGCSPRMGTFLQLLKETGMRCGEAWVLNWHDVDTTTRTVRITPEKNSNPRISYISQKLAGMLGNLPKTYGEQSLFKPPTAARPLQRQLLTTAKTCGSQTEKPKAAENNLPHA
jgi:integrase